MSGFTDWARDGYRRRVGEKKAARRRSAITAGQRAVNSPEIEYLVAAYFHQDFDLEADSPIGVIRKFRIDESPEQVGAVCAALRFLLDSGAGEERIARVWLDRSSYDPRGEGVTVSEWLREVVDELSDG
jgi:hypothetical protein